MSLRDRGAGEHMVIVGIADSGFDRRRAHDGDQGSIAGHHLRHGATHAGDALRELLA